eukprot:SAG22_NODE_4909_length_1135_cov_1.081081_2_plen_279_part_01
MAEALEQALTTTSDEGFDYFINYRVRSDAALANALFKLGSAMKFGAGERRVHIYLDKVRLLDGQRFDVGFTIGLAKSLVFAPLMSAKCLKSLTALGATDDWCDFVLAEYIMAFALHNRGIVKAIMPVIVNEQDDGTHNEAFFQELLSGNVDGAPLPDVVSEKTMAKAAEFLALLPPEHGGPIELTAEERGCTIKKTVGDMLNFQAVLLHFLNPDGDKLAELSGRAIGSSHGEPMVVEKTRKYIVTKLAERLVGTAEKCAPADTLSPDGAEPQPEEDGTE